MTVTINGEPVAKRQSSAIAFPYTDMTDAIAVADGLLKGGGVALTRDQLAAAMEMSPGGGGFATKVATARIFGVMESKAGKYALTDIGYEIVDPSRQAEAKIKAFLAVPLYQRMYEEFRGKLLPPRPHGLERAMVNFGVTEKNARHARLAFEKSARLAGFYPGGNEDRLVLPFGASAEQPTEPVDLRAENLSTGAPDLGRPMLTTSRPLEYQLVDLMKEEGIGESESQAIWTLVRFLSSRDKAGE